MFVLSGNCLKGFDLLSLFHLYTLFPMLGEVYYDPATAGFVIYFSEALHGGSLAPGSLQK